MKTISAECRCEEANSYVRGILGHSHAEDLMNYNTETDRLIFEKNMAEGEEAEESWAK